MRKLPIALSALALASHATLHAQEDHPRNIKPGDTPVWDAADCWAFKPGPDPYTDDALFDLRPLLDKTAGEKGWIKHDANGDFVRGDNSPIRFWAMGTHGIDLDGPLENVEAQARFLAKRGVNMVRLFPYGFKGEDKEIDGILKTVAAYKKHGIYSMVTIYWRSNAKVFWDAATQDEYKDQWRKVLLRPNPYDPDKKPLKDDPAFAILQIQNEDSFFWWSQMGVNPTGDRADDHQRLDALFKAWLARNNLPPETEMENRFWAFLDKTQVPSEAYRLTMRFYAETMRAFNTATAAFIRDEIGCPVLINAGNWQTADQARLLDLERWTHDANDIIGVNRYMGFDHQNHNGRAGWLIEPGDHFTSASCVSEANWRAFSANVKQVKGKPAIIPEASLVYPNLYQSEGPLLAASYLSLTGVDALFWFQLSGAGYEVGVNPYIGGLWKWPTQSAPTNIGAFPAAAWLYHKGYVKRGAPAVDEKRGLEGDMWELKTPVIAEDSHFDPNQPGTIRAQTDIKDGVPFGAFMVGPVVVEYGKPAAGTTVDLAGNKPADLNRGVIRSNTGELFMNAPEGLFTLNAPCAQGVAGFLKTYGPVSTAALDIRLDNHYAAVVAVSLDNKPLAESAKVLLQITTVSRPDGWEESAVRYPVGQDRKMVDGFRIDAVGKDFWNVQNTLGTVAIKNAALSKATLADANFYAAGDVPVERQGGKLLLKLPKNAMYIVIQ
ncbi:MAG: hypothetical protein FWF96_02560 [Kiritimatiellaeota bacterium]|nr:hypothetical protein [Kiritimatiellota bacterium]